MRWRLGLGDPGGLRREKLCLCFSKCTELMRGGSTPGCVVRDGLYRDLYKKFLAEQEG